MFSNLELTQSVHDLLKPEDKDESPFPLADTAVEKAVLSAIDKLMVGVFSRKPVLLTGERLQAELGGVAALYYDQERMVTALKILSDSYDKK